MGKTYRKYCINEGLLKEKSEKQSYFLGYFAADGNVRPTSIRITSGDKEAIQNIRSCLSSEHPIKNREKRETFIIDLCSKKLAEELREIGFSSKKSGNLVFPNNVVNNHFIRGFFDGDGGVSVSKGYLVSYFTSKDKQFLQQIRDTLYNEAGCSRKKIYNGENAYSLKYGQKDTQNLYNYMYPAKYFLSRKKEIFESIDAIEDDRWTEDDIYYLKSNFKDYTDKELGSSLGRSEKAVEAKRISLNLIKYDSISERGRNPDGTFV